MDGLTDTTGLEMWRGMGDQGLPPFSLPIFFSFCIFDTLSVHVFTFPGKAAWGQLEWQNNADWSRASIVPDKLLDGRKLCVSIGKSYLNSTLKSDMWC